MKQILLLCTTLLIYQTAFCWGFYAHQKINYYSVFLLPPQMLLLYKQNIQFISEHAVDPDKRRYAVAEEGPRHYIDLDHYGTYPFNALHRRWDSAVVKFGEDTLQSHGIIPWWVQAMKVRLTNAFKEKNAAKILKLSAEIGHYIADAHVPLHASSNHDGQYTDQKGIHGFWESRVPELLAEKEWDFFIGKADYIKNTQDFIWKRVLESAAAADTVLKFEKTLSKKFSPDQRFSFEQRNGVVQRQYSTAYAKAYNKGLNGMIERRMRQSIYAVASFWYTAWVDAGQPDLSSLTSVKFSEDEQKEFEELNRVWRTSAIKSRPHE
ncbi:MAG TPA: zinc dependent phospholipase C family protein [Flavisolibacter sp.]|nr:zinc dependent phospholipase C family protein [Flavisolibacter sp.]